MKNLTRRTFVQGAIALAVAGYLGFKGSKRENYVFFPETHGMTSADSIVSYARKNHIDDVALEGVPQGIVDEKVYNELSDLSRKYKQNVDLFSSELDTQASPKEVGALFDKLINDSVLSKNDAHEVRVKINALIRSAKDAHGYNSDVRRGNTFDYVNLLRKNGIRVIGVEDPVLKLSNDKDVYSQFSVNDFYLSLVPLRTDLDMLSKKVRAPADVKTVRRLMKITNDLESTVKKDGLVRDTPYSKEYGQHLLSLRADVVRKKSQLWMDYLKQFDHVMLVSGSGHTEYNAEFARKQGRTYTIVKDSE